MAKPLINTTLEQLGGESARGAASGSTQRSARNVMPGPDASVGGSMGAAGGAGGAGTAGNPSRTGMPPVSRGNYQQISGSPSPGMPAPNSPAPHMHALTMASLTHLKNAGMAHPHHEAIMSNSRAGIAKFKKAQAPKPQSFGSIGKAFKMGAGGAGGGLGGGLSPAGSAIPGGGMGAGMPGMGQQGSGNPLADDGL